MSLAQEEKFPSFEAFESDFAFYLKDRIRPAVYRVRFTPPEVARLKIRVGASVPDIVDDSKTGNRIVRFHNYDRVWVAEARLQGAGVFVSMPKREDIFSTLENSIRSNVMQTEGTLLQHVHERLVHIPLVELALSPITEIIREIHDRNEIAVRNVASGRGEEKARRYLTFLEGLEMIEERTQDHFVAGPSYSRNEKQFDTEETLYDAILAEVLRRGHTYLAMYLRLSQIVPFIRVSNSYFLPARAHKHLIYMDKDEFKRKYLGYYGRPKTIKKMFKHVEAVRKVRVFDPGEKSFIVADRDLFQRYLRTALVSA